MPASMRWTRPNATSTTKQNHVGRKIVLIELTTTHWETIRDNFLYVQTAITDAKMGGYAVVRLPRPTRARRPYLPTSEC
jgi:hypothetical protein